MQDQVPAPSRQVLEEARFAWSHDPPGYLNVETGAFIPFGELSKCGDLEWLRRRIARA